MYAVLGITLSMSFGVLVATTIVGESSKRSWDFTSRMLNGNNSSADRRIEFFHTEMIELKKKNNELNHADGSRFGTWVMDKEIHPQIFILIRVFITLPFVRGFFIDSDQVFGLQGINLLSTFTSKNI